MLFRTIAFTLLLGGTVAVQFALGTPEELGGANLSFLFVFITAVYLLNISYAIALRFLDRLTPLAVVQVALDLVTSAMLVHVTGSAESAFIPFFLLSPVSAALTLSRRAALVTALFGTGLFGALVGLGYAHLLPVLPGQNLLPWNATIGQIGRSILLTGGAMFAIAVLSGYLADQLRTAALRVAEQHAYIQDLSTLNADIIRCLTSGLMTIDREQHILSFNLTAGEILDLAPNTVIGRHYAEVLPRELVELLQDGDEIRRGEITLNDQGEPRSLGVSISRLTDHQGNPRGRIMNFQDLTTLRRMEQMMKRSEHLASLGRMAAGIAHEIRNPLASISGSLELLKTEPNLAVDSKRLMEISLREIDRLDGLISSLLEYTRPRQTKLVPLDFGECITTLSTNMRELNAKERIPNIEIKQLEPSLWIMGDHDLISGMLWNLLRNAWEAGEHDCVHISLGSHEPDRLYMEFTDQGIGIQPEDLEHIFEPFFTTKIKGSGLGLATVHRTVQDHGGTIEVYSTPGKGTTMTLIFPRIPAPKNPDLKT